MWITIHFLIHVSDFFLLCDFMHALLLALTFLLAGLILYFFLNLNKKYFFCLHFTLYGVNSFNSCLWKVFIGILRRSTKALIFHCSFDWWWKLFVKIFDSSRVSVAQCSSLVYFGHCMIVAAVAVAAAVLQNSFAADYSTHRDRLTTREYLVNFFLLVFARRRRNWKRNMFHISLFRNFNALHHHYHIFIIFL